MADESTAALLERVVEQTQRSRVVTAAAVAVALNGALQAVVGLQLGFAVRLIPRYEYVPHAMLALGIGLVALASKIFRQRLWAVVLALALSALGTIAMGVWLVVAVRGGMFSLLGSAAPGGCLAAAVFAGLAVQPCARTRDLRQEAARAGIDVDL
jgi:peptidoglycan/LPS O-acetylase OafA/YrhL